MARTIAESITKLGSSRSDINSALVAKGQQPPSEPKISAVATYIREIDTGVKVTINVTAPDYNGQTLTATKGSKKFTNTVAGSTCDITVDEEGVWTVSAPDGNIATVDVKLGYPLELTKYKIYGYEVKQTESDPDKRVTYTDNAVGYTPARMNYSTGKFEYGSWADIWFMTGNHVYQFYADKYNDSNFKQLNDTDYSKCIDGTTSGYNMTNGLGYDLMASFPLCWIHRSQKSDGTRVVKIAETKIDNTYHAYGWEDENGNVQDVFYVGAFETITSVMYNETHSNAPFNPAVSQTASTELSNATKKGTGWNPLDFCKWTAIQDLLVLISKSTNSQTAFGYGYANGNSAALRTGSLYQKGQFWGEQTGKQSVKAFHLEDWWGNIRERIAGFVIKTDGRCYVKTHAPYNTDGTGYTLMADVPKISTNFSGYISAGKSTEYGFVATATSNGSETTYECDQGFYYIPSSGVFYPYVGGYWNNNGAAGAFFFYGSSAPSITDTSVGTRLAYTPQGTTSNPSA